MKTLWVHRDIDAPPEAVWALLADPAKWPEWGPTVRSAELQGDRLSVGATGTVTTVLGVRLSFEITSYDEGERWGWKVAGIPATDHTVEPLGPHRCRAGLAAPWAAAPYLAVCRVALGRLDAMANLRKAAT